MSGPTDTIDIDFLWYGQSVPDHVLAVVERAGKAWSYRLKDVLGPHRLTDGVVTRLGLGERGHAVPYYNDGILVDAELGSYSFGGLMGTFYGPVHEEAAGRTTSTPPWRKPPRVP